MGRFTRHIGDKEVNLKGMEFRAYSVTNEIELNKIAVKCGIPKKYTWEEPLILQGEILASIMSRKLSEEQQLMLFSFGSIVLINMQDDVMPTLLEYLRSFEPNIDIGSWNIYSDDYELRIGDTDELELTDKYAAIPNYEIFYPELVSTILAKSVALEKSEDQLGKILDKLEAMIERLEMGKLRIGDRELAKTTAKVARHEYNTINYIMILDKPDVTWSKSNAAEFYDRMSIFFELSDRFEILTKKTAILNNIIDGFSSISHSIRGLFVEWVIVILIIVEVVLMIAELLK